MEIKRSDRNTRKTFRTRRSRFSQTTVTVDYLRIGVNLLGHGEFGILFKMQAKFKSIEEKL